MNKYLEKIAMRAYDRVRMLKMFGADRIEGESHKAFLNKARKQDPKTFQEAYSTDSSAHNPELKRRLAKAREGVWKKTQGESYLDKDQIPYVRKLTRMASKSGTPNISWDGSKIPSTSGTEFYAGIRDGKLRSPNFGKQGAGSVTGLEQALGSPGSIHLHPGVGRVKHEQDYRRAESRKSIAPNSSSEEMHETYRLRFGGDDFLGRMSGTPRPFRKVRLQEQDHAAAEKRARRDFLKRLSQYGNPDDPDREEVLRKVITGNRAERLLDKTLDSPGWHPKRRKYLEDVVEKSKNYFGTEQKRYQDELRTEQMRHGGKYIERPSQTPAMVSGTGDYTSNLHQRQLKRSTKGSTTFGVPGTKGHKTVKRSREIYLKPGQKINDLIVRGSDPNRIVTNTTVGKPGITPQVKYMTRDYTPGKYRNRNFQTTEPTAPAKARGSFHNLSIAEKRQVADHVREQMGKPHPEL